MMQITNTKEKIIYYKREVKTKIQEHSGNSRAREITLGDRRIT